MLEQLKNLSPDIGIGYFFMYENQLTCRVAIENLQKLRNEEINEIIEKLCIVENKLLSDCLPLQQISKSGKSKSETMIQINSCLRILREELQRREAKIVKQQTQREKQKSSSKMVVFNWIKYIVVGTLGLLFIMSLFSNDDWSDEESFSIQQESVPMEEVHMSNYKEAVHNQDRKQQIASRFKENQKYRDFNNHEIQADELKQPNQMQQNLQSNTGQSKNETLNTVVFSDSEGIQSALEFSYSILLNFLPQETAKFICQDILLYLFWILTAIFGLFEVLA